MLFCVRFGCKLCVAVYVVLCMFWVLIQCAIDILTEYLEQTDLLEELLSHRPLILFNPAYIYGKLKINDDQSRVAMETFSRNFEEIAKRNNVTIVR